MIATASFDIFSLNPIRLTITNRDAVSIAPESNLAPKKSIISLTIERREKFTFSNTNSLLVT